MAWTILNWLFALLVCGALVGVIVACIIGDPVEDTVYDLTERDERTDNIVDLVARLKASRPAVFPSAQTPGEPRGFYSSDAVQPHTGGGMGLARESRDLVRGSNSRHRNDGDAA